MPKKAKGVYASGVRDLTRALGKMDKSMRDATVDAGKDLAKAAIRDVARNARTRTEQATVATFKAYRTRVPEFGFPARAKTGVSGGATAADLFYGTEHGGRGRPSTRQFRPYRRGGYFLWPTVADRGAGWASDYFHLVAEALEDDWNAGARKAAR